MPITPAGAPQATAHSQGLPRPQAQELKQCESRAQPKQLSPLLYDADKTAGWAVVRGVGRVPWQPDPRELFEMRDLCQPAELTGYGHKKARAT